MMEKLKKGKPQNSAKPEKSFN